MGINDLKSGKMAKNVILLDPFTCDDCGYAFAKPKIFLDRGIHVPICPFCKSTNIREFELSLSEEELDLLTSALRTLFGGAPDEKQEGLKKKLTQILDLARKSGKLEIQVKKS